MDKISLIARSRVILLASFPAPAIAVEAGGSKIFASARKYSVEISTAVHYGFEGDVAGWAVAGRQFSLGVFDVEPGSIGDRDFYPGDLI